MICMTKIFFNFPRLIVVAILLLCIHPIFAQAQEVEVRIAADKPRWQISKHLLGTHFVYCNERDDIYADGRIADWMKSVQVGVARWPGGTSVKFLHWETPTGVLIGDIWDPRYDRSQMQPASQFMDLDEYLAFCRRSGAEPMVGVNLQSAWELKRVPDGVAEAVRCVEHCRANGATVKWWYLGNEEGIKPRDLAGLVNLHADAMRKIDPGIKIIVNNNSANPAKALGELLTIAGRNIDVYEIHWKWPRWKEEGTPERWMKDVPLFGGRTARMLADVRAKAVELGYPHLLVANNEWGLSTQMKGFDKYMTGLVAVEYLLDLFASGYDMACYWTTQWPKIANIHLLDAPHGYALNPVAKGFELLASALNQRMLESTTTRPDVHGFACRDDQGRTLQLFLINKNAQQMRLSVALDGVASTRGFDASGLMMKTPGNQLQSLLVAAEGEKFITTLPPFSFCRLTFQSK